MTLPAAALPPTGAEARRGIWRAALQARGTALVPKLFDAGLVDSVASALDRARSEEEQRLGREFMRSIGRIGYVSDLLAMGQPIIDLLADPALHAVLDDVFEEEVRLRVGQGICLDPGLGRNIWPRCGHADMFGQSVAFGDPGFIYAVNCLVFLDDVEEANGATVVLEGSHRTQALLRDEDGHLESRSFRAEAPRGSALLIEGGTWHAARFNRSTKVRRVLKLLFVRRWICAEVDYLALADDTVASRLPASVRRLIDVAP